MGERCRLAMNRKLSGGQNCSPRAAKESVFLRKQRHPDAFPRAVQEEKMPGYYARNTLRRPNSRPEDGSGKSQCRLHWRASRDAGQLNQPWSKGMCRIPRALPFSCYYTQFEACNQFSTSRQTRGTKWKRCPRLKHSPHLCRHWSLFDTSAVCFQLRRQSEMSPLCDGTTALDDGTAHGSSQALMLRWSMVPS